VNLSSHSSTIYERIVSYGIYEWVVCTR
jgi:hypothetical protein